MRHYRDKASSTFVPVPLKMVAMHLHLGHILVIAMAGWINREQSAVIEYLKEENRVLRELVHPIYSVLVAHY